MATGEELAGTSLEISGDADHPALPREGVRKVGKAREHGTGDLVCESSSYKYLA